MSEQNQMARESPFPKISWDEVLFKLAADKSQPAVVFDVVPLGLGMRIVPAKKEEHAA